MKRTLMLFGILSLTLAALLVWGCNSDDDNPVKPGDTDDPAYTSFVDQFEGVSNITGYMLELTFQMADSISSTVPSAPSFPKTSADITPVIVWSAAAGAWIITVDDFDNNEGTVFDIVDTLKFYHGATAVQWPDDALLTRLDSYCWMIASGENEGTAFERVSITRPDGAGTSLFEIDGAGGVTAIFEYSDLSQLGTTTCAGNLDFDVTFTDLILDDDVLFDAEGEMNCPQSGTLGYTGSMNLVCSGVEPASVTGNWSVSETFNNGSVAASVTHGDKVWSTTGECGFEPDYTADSVFVTDILNPETMRTVFQSLDVTVALMDSIPGAVQTRGEHPRVALSDDFVVTGINSYSYSAGWHIFNFEAVAVDYSESDTSFITGVDSIQVVESGSPVQYPSDDPADWQTIRERAHAIWEDQGSGSEGALHHRAEAAFAAAGENFQITINGTVRDTMQLVTLAGDLGDCEAEITLTQDIDDIVMVGGNSCPSSGSVAMTSTVDAGCYNQQDEATYDVGGSWTVTMTGNGDSVTLTYTHKTLTWTTTVPCDTPPGIE